MRKNILVLLGSLALGLTISGTASAIATLDKWTFDFSGVDGLPAGTIIANVNQFTFAGIAHAQTNDANGNGLPDVGETFITDGHEALTSFIDDVGDIIPAAANGQVLNINYEVTFDFSMNGRFQSLNADGTLKLTHFGPLPAPGVDGLLDVYIDATKDASIGSGNGYTDGVQIAQFVMRRGGGGAFDLSQFDGSDDATFDLVWALPGVFLDEFGNDLTTDPYEGMFMISDSNFDADPRNQGTWSIPTPTNWAAYFPGRTGAGLPTDFFCREDGSGSLGVVPEPGTMILLGSGLLGAAGLGRRRSKKS